MGYGLGTFSFQLLLEWELKDDSVIGIRLKLVVSFQPLLEWELKVGTHDGIVRGALGFIPAFAGVGVESRERSHRLP